jgi:transcriptional regulator with AAA-type ATPase domain
MVFLTAEERGFAAAISRVVYANPFLPERIEGERAALGDEWTPTGPLWHARADLDTNPNLAKLGARVEALAGTLRQRLGRGGRPSHDERALCEDVVVYLLFHRYQGDLYAIVERPEAATRRLECYDRFARDLEQALPGSGEVFPLRHEGPHLFACFFQIRRAFHYIFRNILGGSLPAARLRAAVWQSIFTRDLRRYRRTLYQRMDDIATLICGPSGTGKELVARAIGLARYIPFEPGARRFAQDFAAGFHALNLAALSPTLIESELFGHRRGAFTGALEDRPGWLEVCPPLGSVFLDEIGEVDVAIQVKLLRVLQTRTFQRLGDTRDRTFPGKLVAATNRDLASEIGAGRFRADLYYRLCSDLILTPSLREQLHDAPGELRTLLRALAGRIAGEEEADAVADEAERWIASRLGSEYPWPGNVRELEQCVRNVLVRGEYRPPALPTSASDAPKALAEAMLTGGLTAEELLRRYCTLVYARTGSYVETARRLGLDRRTVRERIDPALLAELRAGDSPPG